MLLSFGLLCNMYILSQGSRNCERVDIRANPRLTAHHGVIIAKALMRNFNSIPSPIFLTQAPPLPPPISDEDEIEERVRLEGEALVALRNASEGTAVAAELGYCLQVTQRKREIVLCFVFLVIISMS